MIIIYFLTKVGLTNVFKSIQFLIFIKVPFSIFFLLNFEYNIKCQLQIGIILCGPPCTGKTSTLKVLVDSLSELARITPDQSKQVFKIQKNIKNAHKIRQ